MNTRRSFIDSLGRLGLAGAAAPLATACANLRHSPARIEDERKQTIRIDPRVWVFFTRGGKFSRFDLIYK